MRFGLTDEQRLLDDSVRRFLAERLPIARVRELRDAGGAFDAAAWKELAELGAVGCLVPEEFGGAGLGVLEAAVIATALGHGAAPLPFLGPCVMAPLLLRELGSKAQQQRWLPALAAGDARIAVAAAERVERRQDAGVASEGGRLSGTALFVIDGPGADAYLVPTGDDLWLVPAAAPGLEVVQLPTLDATRSLAELRFTAVEPAERLGAAGAAGPALDRAIDVARALLAADLLGCCDRALELAVAYAMQRRQFDRPIASFQAVKHLCAEMAAAIEPARSLVWYAAHAFDAMPGSTTSLASGSLRASLAEEPPVLASLAKAHLAEVATFVVRTATEVHGGIGFTDACDLHFWFKRAALGRQLLGGPSRLRERAAALQGWTT
jgi:alkylation response protein AidB-like acyl-CoA dehydrogenase